MHVDGAGHRLSVTLMTPWLHLAGAGISATNRGNTREQPAMESVKTLTCWSL